MQVVNSQIISGKKVLLRYDIDAALEFRMFRNAKLPSAEQNSEFRVKEDYKLKAGLPTLLPHAAGLNFAKEVEVLLKVRNNPKKPFIAIMGGAKVKDKLPVISVLAEKADAVLVGGKLVAEIREQNLQLPSNVLVGKLNEDGFDISADTTSAWSGLISKAAQIIWNGPLGKFEDPKYNQTKKVAAMILNSNADIVIGGGDSVAALSQYQLLDKAQSKGFVSVGGGAMLKLLSDGTLSTIEALA